MNEAPKTLVFAGPNGSGKTTVTKGISIIGEYINADEIKKVQCCTDLEAAQIATSLREKFIEENRDLTFETVLSTDRNVDLIKKAKDKGYKIEVIFILTNSADINVQRVKNRVKTGGHDVPEEKIRNRYTRSLNNISKILKIVDRLHIFDNSTQVPNLIVKVSGGVITYFENNEWSFDDITNLLN